MYSVPVSGPLEYLLPRILPRTDEIKGDLEFRKSCQKVQHIKKFKRRTRPKVKLRVFRAARGTSPRCCRCGAYTNQTCTCDRLQTCLDFGCNVRSFYVSERIPRYIPSPPPHMMCRFRNSFLRIQRNRNKYAHR